MAIINPAAAALRAFIDREVAHALRQLRIPSPAALRRERRDYEGHYVLDGNYDDVRGDITARLEALELIDGLAGDGVTNPLDDTGGWVCELRALLPIALKRPLTITERAEVFAQVDRAKAAERAEEERERLEWERSAEGKKWRRAVARMQRQRRAA